MPGYDSFIDNNVENAALNLAENIWSWAPFAMHHVFIPLTLYSAYVGVSLVKGTFDKIADFAYRRVASQPPQAQAPQSGFIMRAVGLSWAMLREGIIVLGFQKASGWSYRKEYWDACKPAGVAFLQGAIEKLIPPLADIFDKGDLNFSAREFVPNGGVFSSMARGVRSLWRRVKDGREPTFAEKVAPEAYQLGQYLADSVVDKVSFTKSVIVGSYQAVNCVDYKLLRGVLRGEEGSCAKMHEEYQTVKPLVDTVVGYAKQIGNDALEGMWDQAKAHPYIASSAIGLAGVTGLYFGYHALKGSAALLKAKTWDYFYPPQAPVQVQQQQVVNNAAPNGP